MAAMTPSGVTITLMRMVMTKVPKMAGKMPPSVFASRGSSLKNSQRRLKKMPQAAAKSEFVRIVEPDDLPGGERLFLAGRR